MDRGAARSRKRAAKLTQPTGASASAASGPSTKASGSQDQPRPPRPERPKKIRIRPGEQSTDPVLYKPKAIRTSAALIYSETPFPIPPPKETLANVRRVDLSGSGVSDVSWLEGMGVTWLSLAGCEIQQGWESVGTLQELSVLNISGCGLKQLPESLGQLTKLKAIVAMNNQWNHLDSTVVASWTELNSLIVSHSSHLTALPPSLASLQHLAKLTFSHCPRLTATGIPDLSALPLLRDVKMNNLPQLTSLPSHISSWGKGDLSLVQKGKAKSEDYPTTSRKGDGLEVLDLGNCSLPFTAIAQQGLAPASSSSSRSKSNPLWPHLRSLSLHSNPLTTTHPNYVELLQSSKDLPNLQIIDAKRVVERKRKGEISESKHDKLSRERKEKKMRPSGANTSAVSGGVKIRQWGGAEGGEEVGDDDKLEEDGNAVKERKHKKEKKEKRKAETVESTHPHKKRRHEEVDLGQKESKKQKKHEREVRDVQRTPAIAAATAAAKPSATGAIDPTDSLRQPVPTPESGSASNTNAKDRAASKDQTSVVGVVEVRKSGEEVNVTSKKRKMIKAKLKKHGEVGGGVDLRQVFAKGVTTATAAGGGAPQGEGEGAGEGVGSGLGLGVGGW